MAGVNPSKFVNYISEHKKILVTRQNGPIQQKFKIDSATNDKYYFSIVNSNCQLINLSNRSFRIYGSIFDAKEALRVLFYSDDCTINQSGTEMCFTIETYTSQYMDIVKTNKIIDITIVETVDGSQEGQDQMVQTILRDEAIAYKRPYIDNVMPAQIVYRNILTGTVPWVDGFGAGQDINLIAETPNFAFGTGLETNNTNQFVIGQYNTPDAEQVFIIGNGDDPSNRSNIFTIDGSGNVTTSGAISAQQIYLDGQDITSALGKTYYAGTGLALDDQTNTFSLTAVIPTVPTNVGAFTNDVGYLTNTSLNGYATQNWVTQQGFAYSSQLTSYALKTDVKTYTASGVIKINDQNVIYLDGDVGQTYTADGVTLQLSNANQFSVKSIRTKLNNGPGISLTEDANGVVTITNTGGSGGGGGYVYTNGTGLGLSAVVADEEYQFYVDEAWLTGIIEAQTSGLQNYSAGTGINISNENVISVTGMVTTDQIVDMATKTWVGQQGFLTNSSLADYAKTDDLSAYALSSDLAYVSGVVDLKANASALDDYALKSEIPQTSAFVTSTQLTEKLNDYALTSDIPTDYLTSSDLIGYATTGWVEEKHYATTGDLNSASTTIVDSLTAYQTKADSLTAYNDLTGKIDYISGVVDTNIESINSISNAMNEKQDKSAMSAYATSTWVTQNYLPTGSLDDYLTSSEVNSAIETATDDMATQTWVAGQIDEFITVDDLSGLDNRLTAIEADYITSSDMTATSTWVNETFETIDNVNALTGRVKAIEDDYTTSAYVTGQVNDLATGAVATNTTNIGLISSDLATKVTSSDVATQVEAYGYATTGQLSAASGTLSTTIETVSTTIMELIPSAILTKVSQLENDSQFITLASVDSAIDDLSAVISTNYLTGVDLTNYALKADLQIVSAAIPTAVSELTNDVGYLTAHQSLADYYNKNEVDSAIATATGALSTELTGWVNDQNYLTAHQSLNGYATEQWVEDKHYLTGVDLTNYATKSQIPTKVSDLDNDQGYITGIANNALLSDVNSAIEGLSAVISTNYATTGQIPDTSNLATKTELSQTSTAIVNLIPEVSGKADLSAVEAVDAKFANYSTSEQIAATYATEADLQIVSSALDNYVTTDTLTTGYDTSSEVDDKITAAIADIDFPEGVNYTAGEGLGLSSTYNGKEFYLTAEIPSIEGLATTEYVDTVSGNLHNEVTAAINTATGAIPTNVSELTNDANYATAAYVDEVSANIVTGQITGLASDLSTLSTQVQGLPTQDTTYTDGNLISITGTNNSINFTGTIPTVASLSAGMYEATSASIEDQITGKGYITGYEAGEGIDIQDGIISCTVQGGGDGKYYDAGTGIIVDNTTTTGTISIDQNWLENNFAPVITNKRKIIVDSEVKDPTYKLTYAADTDVFVNTIETDNGVLTLTQVSGFTGDNGQVATFEQWIKPDGTLTSVLGDGVELVNIPTSFTSGLTQVFTRRIVKLNNTVSQYAVWEYEFNNAAIPETDKIIATSPQDFTFELSSNTTSPLVYSTVGNPSNIGFTLGTDLPAGISFSNGSFSNTGSQMAGNGNYTMVVTISATNTQSETITKQVLANLTLTGFELVEVPNQEFGFTYNTNATSSVAFTYHGNQAATTGVTLTGSYSLPAGISFNNGTFTCTGASLTGNTTTPLTAVISAADADSITTEFDLEISGVPIIASNQTFNFDMREADQQSGTLVYTHLGSGAVNVAFSPSLVGITYNAGVFSGIAGTISNGTQVVSATISADDADSAVISTTFNVVGVVENTIDVSSATFDFNFASETSIANTLTFDYQGSYPVSASVANLPAGIEMTRSGNALTFTGTKENVNKNGLKSATVTLVADDTAVTEVQVDFDISGIEEISERTPITFEAVSGGANISLVKNGNATSNTYQYTTDGSTWNNYILGTSINLNEGDTVSFSGANTETSKGIDDGFYSFNSTNGKLKVYGNAYSLQNFTYNKANMAGLFNTNTHIVDASKLLLPATTLTDQVYMWMFRGCTELLLGPEQLPVNFSYLETLAGVKKGHRFQDMFSGCTKLTKAFKNLIPKDIVESDYYGMFYQCSSLIEAPELFISSGTTIDVDINATMGNFQKMYFSCKALKNVYVPYTSAVHPYQYTNYMQSCSELSSIEVDFTEWSNATNVYNNWNTGLPATGVFYKPSELTTETGYNRIPEGWTVVNKMTIDPVPAIVFNYSSSASATSSIASYIHYDGSDSALTYQIYGQLPEGVTFANGTFSCVPSAIVGDSSSNVWVLIKSTDKGTARIQITVSVAKYAGMPLTLEAIVSTSVGLFNSSDYSSYSFQKSLDLGTSWSEYHLGQMVDLNEGETVSFSANITDKGLAGSQTNKNYRICLDKKSGLTSAQCKIKVYGNPRSLAAWSTTTYAYHYSRVFSEFDGLYDASNLVFDSVIDKDYCLQRLFTNDVNLSSAPLIPAYTSGSLVYTSMFEGCTGLREVRVAWTSWPGNNSTQYWIYGVPQNVGTFYKPAALSAKYGDNFIPSGWTVVNTD